MMEYLFCGAAMSDITPPLEMLPNLRGLMQNRFGDINDRLYVRVISLSCRGDRALIVGFDLDKAPNPDEHIIKISERYRVAQENILYYGIHTHSAPIIGRRPAEPPMNSLDGVSPEVRETSDRYAEMVFSAMYKAIDEAILSERPARMGCAMGKSFINVNRIQDFEAVNVNDVEHVETHYGVNPEGEVDHTLFVLRFDDVNGNTIAFLINYPVHNVVMWRNRCANGLMSVSGDIGGTVSRYTEQKFPGSVALWCSGAAGDLNPVIMNELSYPDPLTGEYSTYLMPHGDAGILKILASRHFADVLKTNKTIDWLTDYAEISGVVEWVRTPAREPVLKDNGAVEFVMGKDIEPYEVRMQLLRIGYVAMMGISGELFSSFGKRIKDISLLKNTIIINHNCSFLSPRTGYVMDDNMLSRPSKHSRRSRIVPGHLLESFEETTIKMFEKVFYKKNT